MIGRLLSAGPTTNNTRASLSAQVVSSTDEKNDKGGSKRRRTCPLRADTRLLPDSPSRIQIPARSPSRRRDILAERATGTKIERAVWRREGVRRPSDMDDNAIRKQIGDRLTDDCSGQFH